MYFSELSGRGSAVVDAAWSKRRSSISFHVYCKETVREVELTQIQYFKNQSFKIIHSYARKVF